MQSVITMHGQLIVEPALVAVDSFADHSRASEHTTGRAVTTPAKPWAKRLSAVFFVVVGGALVMNRDALLAAVTQVRGLSIGALGGLGALVLLHKLCHVTMQSASVPDVSFGRVAMATEAYVGASNSMIGGAGIGTGVRAAMLRSWGVAPTDIAVSVVATGLAPSFAMWGIALAHTLPIAVLGHANKVHSITVAASVIALVGPGLFWWLALRSPEVLAWVARMLGTGRALLLAVLPECRLTRSAIARLDLPETIEDMRLAGRSLAQRRGVVIIVAAVGGQLMLALLLLGCVRALGPTGSAIDAIAVLRAFALLRVLSSFVPVPGGIGVIDLGLLGVLVSGGVSRPTAVAAIGLYRALTFFLPMVTGSVCALIWRTRQRGRAAAAAKVLRVLDRSSGFQAELSDRRLPHLDLAHLARHRHRELTDDLHVPRDFVVGDLAGAELADRLHAYS